MRMICQRVLYGFAGVLLAGALALAAPAVAAPKQYGGVPYETLPNPRMAPGPGDANMTRRIGLAVGKSIIVDLPKDAGEVFIGNPAIVNAVVRTPRKLFLIAAATGTTSVFVMDPAGAQIASLEVAVAKEMGQEINILRSVLGKALPKAEIKIESVAENIVLSGTVDSALDAQTAVELATNLVGNSAAGGVAVIGSGKVINALQIRGRDQVMLKVTVAEVQRSALKQLGVDLAGQWKISGSTLTGQAAHAFAFGSPNNYLNLVTGAGHEAQLRALEKQGLSRTLAEPTLTAVSGETAKFLAGGEIPVPSSETCESGNTRCTVTLTLKSVGVALNFTPVVLSEGRIMVRLATEINEVDSDNSVQLTRISVSGFRTRKTETTVELPSGGVMATAGLIQQVSKQQITGLPGLMNLPILGQLFRSREYQRNETELMILVQPFIAKPSSPGQIARPTDGLNDSSDPAALLLGQLHRVYGGQPNGAYGTAGSKFGFITE